MNISLRNVSVFGKFPFIRIQQIVDNPRYFFHLLAKNIWYKYERVDWGWKYEKIEILSSNDTLDYLLSENVSFARFSDGEFEVLTGAGIYPPDSDWSQKWTKILQKKLSNVLSSKDKRIFLAVDPKETFLSKKDANHVIPFEYNMWIDMRRLMWKLLHEGHKYGHCHLFIKKNCPDLDWKKFRKYISDFDVVVVTGNISSIRHLCIGRTTRFIDVGTEDAFSKLPLIKEKIHYAINENNLEKRNVIVFASLGPTACILAYELLDHDIRVWDTGHMFEFADKNFMESVFYNDNT